MKFETIKYRKNGVEYFGKRVLSWHGCLVFYSVQVYVEPDVYKMWQETMYIDHTNALDNKKDATCVISLIEAIFNYTKRI